MRTITEICARDRAELRDSWHNRPRKAQLSCPVRISLASIGTPTGERGFRLTRKMDMRRFKCWYSFDDSGEFDLRAEAVDWGARIGSLLLMVSVFSPVIGSMRQSQSYIEHSPKSAFLI